MPELPEVEVVKLHLEQKLLHKTITKIEILTPKSFVGDPKLVEGQKIVKFSRLGKQLSIYLSNHLVLLIHLKMTGQLILSPLSSRPKADPPLAEKGVPDLACRQAGGRGILMGHPTKDALLNLPNKSTRIIFYFKNFIFYFNDQRKFGWVRLYSFKALKLYQSNLGPDIFDPDFSPKYLYSQLQKSRRPIKIILLDQHYFAGIGNIYACDALFLAGIHPGTPSNKISRSKALKLHQSLLSIMRQSVLAGGSTARDNQYLRPDGTKGQNQFFFRVYQRKGEPCLNCGTKIEYLKIGGRGTFFCPHCQRSRI
ncbi:MAG TPA: bifunctional DNA-formamidopyrimidine glycosylase/DNA-(apurinic or apyrimidinic site) lyase [Candidatus Woesebacteria bacterium]|nr:bifunctional DNA-formamidopyrimidine glycosylase/DNA-(apurinic or apyrimidinic site) lyase [Candidatus Woesebacteria bacterium]HPR99368.1 bifunctional DNA-formamidopyrimidine glycosylase/DNA-(apurinic or apyrimidinic site) lyase [Candidatus Woesebacteria bacterium]